MRLLPPNPGRHLCKLFINSRYAPVACPRCRRHAAIYDLKYPHRTAPPCKNLREYHFDIQDAKEYVLLKDCRRKNAIHDEVIDITPFLLSDEERVKRRQRSRTPDLEREDTPAESKKRARPVNASTPQPDSSQNKRKKVNHPKPSAPKRQSSARSEKQTSVGPQLSEYEKMQLLIANAEKEATGTTNETTRLRKVGSSTPSIGKPSRAPGKTSKSSQPPPKRAIEISVSRGRAEGIQAEEDKMVEDIQPVIASPKVAVYDEWQELVKKAQEDGEAGLGRSRRTTRRPCPIDHGTPKSPHKRPRLDHLSGQHSDESTPNATEVAPINDTISELTVNTTNSERAQLVDGTFTQVKEDIPSPKTRRNVASLMGDEIVKVKLEMEMAGAPHGPFLSNTPVSPTVPREEKSSSLAKHKEFLTTEVKRVTSRRQSQSHRLPETMILEDNRLFMFAILATEGINE
jgi:hypothetical protein